MRNPPAKLQSLAYTLVQSWRVSSFLSQSILGNLALGRKPSAEQKEKLPSPLLVLRDLQRLFVRDYRNIEAGIYKWPSDFFPAPLDFSKKTLQFFWDLYRVRDRQNRKAVKEFDQKVPAEDFPKYYAQTFHFQTDGYLSEKSAELYDHQVETVFGGGADAMRRQALVPLYHFLEKHPQAKLLDVACGTGRFLRAVKENHEDLEVTGIDLSPWYLEKACENLKGFRHVSFVEANAEETPFKNEAFDLISCVFLFHELPDRVREQVAREMARLLRPGGQLIFVDSIQLGDKPSFDGSLEYFPVNYHEPYYRSYVSCDLDAIFTQAGLERVESDLAFFSKILVYEKRVSQVT